MKSISVSTLIRHLRRSPKRILILDCRSTYSFSQERIVGSLSYPGGIRSFILSFTGTIVVVDNEGLPSSLPKEIREDGTGKVLYLLCGYQMFVQRHPEFIDHEKKPLILGNPHLNRRWVANSVTGLLSFKSEVRILPYLYLGNANNCNQHHSRYDLVINLAGSSTCYQSVQEVIKPFLGENQVEEKKKHYTLNWNDSPTYQIGNEELENLCQIIQQYILKKKKVLLHCRSGVSRSATLAMAFRMYHSRENFNLAWIRTRKVKPNIFPNRGFIEQLISFDFFLHG